MSSMRVVIDTNIAVSAIFWGGNESKVIKLAGKGKIKLLTSVALLNELREVLKDKKFRLDERTAEDHVRYLLTISELVSPRGKLNVIHEDPLDNRVLECALGGKAGYIVSGDKHLLRLKEFKGIKVVRAKELLDILKA